MKKLFKGFKYEKIENYLIAFFVVVFFTVCAYAESTFTTVSLTPGTAGINWTIPDKVSEFSIEAQATDATNWVDISFYQGTGLNWTNAFRIQPGAVYKMSNIWSSGNKVGIKGGLAATVVEITYSQSN